MGHNFYREALWHAPGSLNSGERLVVLAVADMIHDNAPAREGWIVMADLVRATNMKPESVSQTLRRLAAKGLELRVPIGKDKNNNPVFAHSGKSMTYRFPRLAPAGVGDPAENPRLATERADSGRPFLARSPDSGRGFTEESPDSGRGFGGGSPDSGRGFTPERADSGRPLSPQASPHLSLPKGGRAVMRSLPGVTEEEMREVLKVIQTKNPRDMDALIAHMGNTGQLADILDEIRSRPVEEVAPVVALPAKCTAAENPTCGPDRRVEDEDGRVKPCPHCNPQSPEFRPAVREGVA